PHNPVGKVFSKEELIRICHICCKHNVIVASDEIHQDFINEPYKHTVLANLNEKFEQNCIICTAPSKTFNIAGLKVSNIFIPNPELKKKYENELNRRGPSSVNSLGIAACIAAYKYGEQWLNQLKQYLKCNLDFVTGFINENLPKIKLVNPQGTYLIWIDCQNMGLDNEQLNSFFKDEAKLWLNHGDVFGVEGNGFQRINIATSRSVLEKAMNRIKTAYDVLFHEKQSDYEKEANIENLDNQEE
ncbi:MAG: aminotransferase class I/II-fold pyridoxal phosphate-dependent enzyme, partial [Clostridia bacterium]